MERGDPEENQRANIPYLPSPSLFDSESIDCIILINMYELIQQAYTFT